MSVVEIRGVRFSSIEIRDLAIAWIALGIAFSVFILVATGRSMFPDLAGAVLSPTFRYVFAVSLLTVGVGFLLHELAHKIVAIRFGQLAAFRADYKMLALCIGAAFAGFLFAAPGAVYHRGRITRRQSGLIAVAGPVTNIALGLLFLPAALLAGGFVGEVAHMGVLVNVFLAAFNMLPAGPLDGKTVYRWHRGVFAVVLVVAVGLGAAFVTFVGL